MTKPRLPWPPLLDTWERESAIASMQGWPLDEPGHYDGFAKTICSMILEPLSAWIIAMGDDATNCEEVRAATNFLIYADLDVAYRFRQRQSVYPEHINQLDDLWREYQFVTATAIAIGQEMRAAVVSKTNSKSAKGPRKPVTREQLLAHRENYIMQHGHKQGWQKEAKRDFNIDAKTIRNRIRE